MSIFGGYLQGCHDLSPIIHQFLWLSPHQNHSNYPLFSLWMEEIWRNPGPCGKWVISPRNNPWLPFFIAADIVSSWFSDGLSIHSLAAHPFPCRWEFQWISLSSHEAGPRWGGYYLFSATRPGIIYIYIWFPLYPKNSIPFPMRNNLTPRCQLKIQLQQT